MEHGFDMIKVTRLNQTELIINAEKIEFIEAIPDTIITLSSGKKVMVAESVDLNSIQGDDATLSNERTCIAPRARRAAAARASRAQGGRSSSLLQGSWDNRDTSHRECGRLGVG